MNRNTAVMTWRDVCGSDAVMASMPPTGRMLEDFARNIEEAERASGAAEIAALRDKLTVKNLALMSAITTLERDGDEWGICDRLRAGYKA